MFVKIGVFIKLKGYRAGIPRELALLRKSKTPRKSPEKRTSLSLACDNAPSCTLLIFIFSEVGAGGGGGNSGPEQKVRRESCLFSQGKNLRIHKSERNS